jgi:hypothetical protein
MKSTILLTGTVIRLSAALLGIATLGALPAKAVEFDFSYYSTNTAGISGSGEFFGTPLGAGEYELTGITGFGGNNNAPITGLSLYADADNTFSYPRQPYLDLGGISFNTGGPDPDTWNLYWYDGYYGAVDFNTNPVGYVNSVTINLTITQVTPPPTPTPIPAALPLFVGGLGTLGFLARRKKRKSTTPAN